MNNTTTNIIWVTGGLVGAKRLTEALEKVESREMHIIRVPTVQEAVVELLRGELDISLIICDDKLNQSIPTRNLFMAAETEEVPCLVAHADEEGEEEVHLLAPKKIDLPKKSPLFGLLSKFKIEHVDHVPSCNSHCCA